MIYLASSIDVALSAAFWIGLAVACFLLYRTFRLPVLRWIGLYFIISFLTAQLMHFYFHRISLANGEAVDPHSSASLAFMLSSIIDDSAKLLVAILALAEIVVLATHAHPEIAANSLRVLSRAHAYTREIGLVLVILALALPLPAIIYYYSH